MDFNEFQNYNFNNQNSYDNPRRESSFAIASLAAGIFSIITCCTGITCIPLGALGILFALLSRKSDCRFPSMSVAGICTSIIGLAIGALLLYVSFRIVFDPEFRAAYVNPFYQEFYGIDFEEFLQNYYHILNQ